MIDIIGNLCEANGLYSCEGGTKCLNWMFVCVDNDYGLGCPSGDNLNCGKLPQTKYL